jgi:thiol reductant ABC exporter CydC subunit
LAGTGTAAAGVGLLATATYLILRAGEQPPILDLSLAIVGVRFFGISRAALRYAERLSAHDAALRAASARRTRAVTALHRLTPGGLDRDRTGDLLARVTSDVAEVQEALVRTALPPAVAGAAVAIAAGIAALIHPLSGTALAVGAGATAVVAVSTVLVVERTRGRRLVAARAELATTVIDLVEGAREARVYSRTGDLLRSAAEADGRLTEAERSLARSAGLGSGIVAIGTGVTVWAVIRAAADAAGSGALRPLLVGVLAILALAAFETVALLPRAAAGWAPFRSANTRLADLERRPDPVPVPEDPVPLPTSPVLELENVWVRPAPDASWALRGVSLTVAPGRPVALVGASGSGKTTIAETLLRFRAPERGTYRVGGVDAARLDPGDVRTLVGIAAEDAHLVAGSLLDNLRIALPDAAPEDARDALRRVGLGEWLAGLPEWLDTPVGERGREVSGGERRRIALARALLADFPVLIVDEPTAGLDPVSAAGVVDEVLAAAGDRGVLLITHGEEGLEHVDEVVVLSDGEIVHRTGSPQQHEAPTVVPPYRDGV